MSGMTVEDLKRKIQIASSILETKPELIAQPINNVYEILNNDSQETIKHRHAIAALIFIRNITDFSYDSLSIELVNNVLPAFCHRYIMFILQDKHNIHCLKLMNAAFSHNTIDKIITYVEHNIEYEKSISESDILPFFNYMSRIPQNSRYNVFSNISKLITRNSIDNIAFSFLYKNIPATSELFMPCLIDSISKSQIDNVYPYLSTLLNSPHADYWIQSIAVGIENSLQYNTHFFDNNYPTIHQIMVKEPNWPIFIPRCVQYILCELPRSKEVSDSVFLELSSIVSSSIEIKRTFMHSLSIYKKTDQHLEEIATSICEHPYSKDKDTLSDLAYYFLNKIDNKQHYSCLVQLFNLFSANKFNFTDYRVFFEAFSLLWPEFSTAQEYVWQSFTVSFLDSQINSIAFSIGLFENVFDLSIDSINKTIPVSLSEELVCLIIKTICYNSINAESICLFSYCLVNDFSLTDKIQNVFDLLFYMYPNTLHDISNLIVSKCPSKTAAKLSKNMISKYNELIENQKKWQSIPDFLPSITRQEILRKMRLEKNNEIMKAARENSIFANIITQKAMKYGKRSGFIRTTQNNQYEYLSNNYTRIEHKIELPTFYHLAPVEWHTDRLDVFEERMNYIETHN